MFERVLFFCGPHLSLFEFQISEYVYVHYVARPCTLFPAVIEACRRRLCCRCRVLFMRLYGKGDAGTTYGRCGRRFIRYASE